MRTLGSRSEDIVAGVGPAVAPGRYQVGGDALGAAQECFGDRRDEVIRPDGSGKWLFDLWTANQIVLRDAGVQDENVQLAALPTGSAGPCLFFSDREARPCGRFAAMARLRPRNGP